MFLSNFVLGSLWALATLRVVSCVFRGFHDERELRGEASLLLNQVCDIPRASSVGNTLIRCDEAKAVLAQAPLIIVAVERALVYLVIDTLAAARREVGAFLQALGFFGAIAVGGAVCIRTWIAKRRRKRWEFDQMGASSEMFKARTSTVVPLRFTEDDDLT